MTADTTRLAESLHVSPRTLGVGSAVGVAVVVAAVAGTAATIPATGWFRRLDKPAWQPPNQVFGPVWTLLYADIAVTSTRHLVELLESGDEREATTFATALGTNLVLNGGWSYVFWQVRSMPAATAVAAALAASSGDLVRRMGRRPRAAALAPYAVWTAFATVLTAELWRRNR